MPRKCSVCGVRDARFYRRASGDVLCESCLELSLEKAVRKHLRSWGALRPASRVLVPVFETLATHSLTLASLVVKSKRGYGSHVYVAVIDPLAGGALEKAVSVLATSLRGVKGWSLVRVKTRPTPDSRGLDIFDVLRLVRAIAARASKTLGARFALLPLTRTMLLMLASEALARGSCDKLLDLMLEYRVEDVVLVSALYTLEDEAITAYAYMHGLLADSPAREAGLLDSLILPKVVVEALRSGPDLEFSYVNVYNKMAEACVSRLRYERRCASCGAPSFRELCDFCSSLPLVAEIEEEQAQSSSE